jgi:NADH pyrophosphatase NudC (nudix superfamily)
MPISEGKDKDRGSRFCPGCGRRLKGEMKNEQF